jgi:hypothetical protein
MDHRPTGYTRPTVIRPAISPAIERSAASFAPSFRSMVGIGFPNRLTGPDITRTGLQESPTERILYAELSANFTNEDRGVDFQNSTSPRTVARQFTHTRS